MDPYPPGGGEDNEEDDELEVIAVGDKRISIRTSVLEEKATACNMLCCYVDELREGFLPFLQPVVETMVPLLDFYFHEDVRKAAVASLPDILRAGKAAMEKGMSTPQGAPVDLAWFRQLIGYVVPPLVAALSKEPEVEIQAEMLESLADCAGVAGELISEHIVSMIAEFQSTLKRSLAGVKKGNTCLDRTQARARTQRELVTAATRTCFTSSPFSFPLPAFPTPPLFLKAL